MNKFFVSIGLAAIGTAGLHAAYTPEPVGNADTTTWDVSATLRGFYDDNINTVSSGPDKQSSFGFEVSPTLEAAIPLQQTELGMRYVYGLYYYQTRENDGENPVDQSHELDLWLDHAFTERWHFKAQDSFRVGQEPELIDPTGSYLLRTEGNNLGNTITMTLDTDWTRLFSTELGYDNDLFDYQNSGGNATNPSLAGLLNRVQNTLWFNFQWHVLPDTMAFVGYNLELVNYTANEQIATDPITGQPYVSDSRDNISHYFYVGVQQNFSANLTASGRVGAQYTDDYNDNTTQLSPYLDLSATYTYRPGSYVKIGFTQQQNATSIVAPNTSNGQITQSQDSSTGYASINHKLNERLVASVIGQIQYSTYNDGAYNNEADTYYTMGVNLTYTISDHFSADAGYNFDYLASNLPGYEYHRNRVYLGITASY